MSQQINLYQPALRKRRALFSIWLAMQITGVFIIGLAGMYGYEQRQVAVREEQIVVLEQQLRQLVARQQSMSAQQQPVPSRHLEQQVREAEQELAQKQRLAESLAARPVAAASTGFSGHLTALARQRLNGLWLTQIIVQDNGSVTLEGAAEEPELVPRYLDRLGREAAFQGTEFVYLNLVRGEEKTPAQAVTFTASSKQQAP